MQMEAAISEREANAKGPYSRAGAADERWPWLIHLFGAYSTRYLRRHFSAMRISRSGWQPTSLIPGPLVVYGNHGSWWDPLTGMEAARVFFKGRRLFAPMDAAALKKYSFFKRLGFFGVEQESARAALKFLKQCGDILSEPDAMLWLTPQGKFSDPRERPVRFKAGIGHLAARFPGVTFLPVAAEYSFWEERTPEILFRFGTPLHPSMMTARSPHEWTHAMESGLERTLDELARESILREPGNFEVVFQGRAGVGGVYDLWRRLKAGIAGTAFKERHGGL